MNEGMKNEGMKNEGWNERMNERMKGKPCPVVRTS